jgi:hypothetical protein
MIYNESVTNISNVKSYESSDCLGFELLLSSMLYGEVLVKSVSVTNNISGGEANSVS